MRMALSLALVAVAAACGDDAPAADAGPPDARPPGGSISVSWTISDGVNALECEDVGAVNVRVTATPTEGGTATVESLSCSSGSAAAMDIPEGTFDVLLDLRASGNRSLLAAPIEIEDVQVRVNQDSAVGAQTFTVVPSGTFQFTIQAQGVANNCTAGQIVDVEIALADDDGTCIPVLFAVAAGPTSGRPADSYQTVCGAPTTFGTCIENDQVVTATAASGPRRLTITGQKAGPIDCWLGASDFTVLGNNLDTDLQSETLALQTETAGCQ